MSAAPDYSGSALTADEHFAEYRRILFERGWCAEAGDHLVAYYRLRDAEPNEGSFFPDSSG